MKIKYDKKIILVGILIAIILISIIVNIIISNKNEDKQMSNEEIKQIEQKATESKLSNLGEQKRIEYYVTEFIRNLEYKKYDKCYNVLYEDFKKVYFPTQEKFEDYIKTYWPVETTINYSNFERLGEFYLLWLDVDDLMGEKNKFSMNIVVKENDYNDFDLSFSVNSAMYNDM